MIAINANDINEVLEEIRQDIAILRCGEGCETHYYHIKGMIRALFLLGAITGREQRILYADCDSARQAHRIYNGKGASV